MMPSSSPDAPRAGVAAGTQATTAAGAAMPVGVDVSSWQHPSGAAINWGLVAASGQSFAIVKATEGDYYTNPNLAADVTGAHAAGLVVGTYMYAIPSISPTVQADYFANAIRGVPAPSLPPVLDLEESDGLDPTSLVNWTTTFLNQLSLDTGYVPMIYTGPNFWKTAMSNSTAFGQYPLWEAQYTTAASPTPIGAWGSNYSLWQFTSQASIPGIVGLVDQSRFNNSNGADMSALGRPIGSLDSDGVAADGTLTAYGWTFDPDTPTDPVTVHAYLDGQWLGAFTASDARPDVGAAYPFATAAHGFTVTGRVGPGTHTLCLYAIDTTFSGQHTTLGCPSVTLVPTLPAGSFDYAGATGDGTVTVSGWAIDSDTPTTPVTMEVDVDDEFQPATANVSRPDVGSAFPNAGPAHGFTSTAQMGPGPHTVCVYALDTYFPDHRRSFGCRQVTVTPTMPIGSFDYAGVNAGTLTVSGWTFDPDTPTTAGTVHMYVDGNWSQAITANVARPDVGTAYPVAGANHGFAATAPVGPGKHTVCLYAIDTSFAGQHTDMGCRDVVG